jgi:uncharacterized protein (TIGR04222 family)
MNPLDWTAGPFLNFYLFLMVGAAATIFWLRRRIGPPENHAAENALNMLEMAYMAGGLSRAADTVLVGFLSSGAANLDPKTRKLTIDAATVRLPPEIEQFRTTTGAITRKEFRDAILPQLEAIRARLVQRGLVPTPEQIRRLQSFVILVAVAVVAVGVAKIHLGESRHHPTGILKFLVITVVVAAAALLAKPPRRTLIGTTALENACLRYARAIRAPRIPEAALAFAAAGAIVLWGTPFQAFGQIVSFTLGGSTGGGGCGGGSGCGGGGGGGGGGCGGCGGH